MLAILVAACVAPSSPAAEIAPGVELLPGRFVSGTQPDGNTVIFRAPAGLIVLDTGRHAEHTQAIVDYARSAQLPVRAIVNSHWHLDHIGGNPQLRREFPGVRVYASAALADARKGFLASYRTSLQEQIASTPDPEAQKPFRAEIAILDAGPALEPDEIVRRGGKRTIAGKKLRFGLESHAVTAGDVWLYDPATRVLAAGDLVTLPAPFLETACPERWKAALGHLAAIDFELLVPGHGAPMRRENFETYRRAFDELLACAASSKTKEECIDGWLRSAGDLVSKDEAPLARALVAYYVDTSLRGDPAQLATLCGG